MQIEHGLANRLFPDLDALTTKIRYALYRSFTYARYERLGKNNRIKLGRCVEDKIKELFPNPEGVEYTGFQPADEEVLE